MTDPLVRIADPQETVELRRSVLRPNLAPGSTMPGDEVTDAVHIGAFAGSSLVSTCLVFAEACPWLPDRPAWRLRSMATDPDRRGGGFGARVLAGAERISQRHGAELIWCLARISAAGFYGRAGWIEHGEIFPTDYGPHVRMWKELPPPVVLDV